MVWRGCEARVEQRTQPWPLVTLFLFWVAVALMAFLGLASVVVARWKKVDMLMARGVSERAVPRGRPH